MPWVRFFPSDWLGGTRGMSAAETGIYITLVATMYERGEPIPEDHSRLARLCGASNSTFKTALDALVSEGKIIRSEAGLWNDRVEKESVYRAEKSEVGKQAADVRWGNKPNKNNGHVDANALPAQSQRNANQKPEARRDANASLKREIEREFHEQVWPAYPLKLAKPQALKAYIAARQRASFDTILAGVRRYASERAGQDKKYTKQAQGWFSRDGWDDEPIPVVVSPRPYSTGSPQTGGSPKTFDEGGVGPRGQTKFLQSYKPQANQ